MNTMVVVIDKEPDQQIGANTQEFIAIWVEDGVLHFANAMPPEYLALARSIEELIRLQEWGPITNVLELPELRADPDGP